MPARVPFPFSRHESDLTYRLDLPSYSRHANKSNGTVSIPSLFRHSWFPSHHFRERRPLHNLGGVNIASSIPLPACARKPFPLKTAIDIFSMMAIYSCTSQGAPIVVDGERSPSNQIFLAAVMSPSIHPSPIHGFVPFRCALPGAVSSRHPAGGSQDPRTERP